MFMLSCLDPAETLIGTFNEHCSVAGARRTSPSNIASMLPPLEVFGGGEGFGSAIKFTLDWSVCTSANICHKNCDRHIFLFDSTKTDPNPNSPCM